MIENFDNRIEQINTNLETRVDSIEHQSQLQMQQFSTNHDKKLDQALGQIEDIEQMV